MSTDTKISNVIENQFPDFIREDAPLLVKFIKAYYEYMEQDGNVTERSKNLLDYQDIDRTTSEYLDWFKREVLVDIPRNLVGDERLFMKNVLDFYRAKGTEQSVQTLFRALFDDAATVFYPSTQLLKVSDGRFEIINYVRVVHRTGNVAAQGGQTILGETSGAQARVESITETSENGVDVFRYDLSNINGTFRNDEIISSGIDDFTAQVYTATGPLANVTVTQGGAFHRVGDRLQFTDQITGSSANGSVEKTNDTSAVRFSLTNGGNGYTTGATISIVGGSGKEASFRINAVASDGTISVNTDTINNFSHVVLNVGTNRAFGLGGGNAASGSVNVRVANVHSHLSAALKFENLTIGKITSIYQGNFGYGYSTLPSSATIKQESIAELQQEATAAGGGTGTILGENAQITIEHAPGSIESIVVDEKGTGYSKDSLVTLNNLSADSETPARGTVAGNAKSANGQGVTITTGVISETGSYTDTRGFLSSGFVIQDSDYYQDLSYVIKSTKNTKDYRQVIEKTAHPAGVKRFGQLKIDSSNTSMSISAAETIEAVTSALIRGQGGVFVANTTKITFWSSDTQFFTRFANVPFTDVGTRSLLYGNNTFFNSANIISGNTWIRIATANAVYAPTPKGNTDSRAITVYGNSAMKINPVFTGNSTTAKLANADYFHMIDITYS